MQFWGKQRKYKTIMLIKNSDHGGFTLIELLVVISIIGVLATLVIANLNEARTRARDSSRKQNLTQLKTALQLYYNDFKGYPATSGGGTSFSACGALGKTACTVPGPFSVGTAPNTTVYMSQIPTNSTGNGIDFRYYQCGSSDDFRLKIVLENASDPDIASSQLRCPFSTCGLSYGTTDYLVCP